MRNTQNMDKESEDALIGRFIDLRKKYGPTQGKFGEMLGLSDGSVSRLESGQIAMTEKHIKLVCGALGINEAWFREGKGPMLTEEAPGEQQLLAAFRSMSPEGRRLALKLIEDLLESEREQQKGADAFQNAPGGATQPPEAPQEAKPASDTEKGESRADTSEKPV
jgi:transcriptional regulator with XRE-family HTH domain